MKTDLITWPTVAALVTFGDLAVLSDLDFDDCSRCNGSGCAECGDTGIDQAKCRTLYALGVPGEFEAGIRGGAFTLYFPTMEDLEAHCAQHRAAIEKEIEG